MGRAATSSVPNERRDGAVASASGAGAASCCCCSCACSGSSGAATAKARVRGAESSAPPSAGMLAASVSV